VENVEIFYVKHDGMLTEIMLRVRTFSKLNLCVKLKVFVRRQFIPIKWWYIKNVHLLSIIT